MSSSKRKQLENPTTLSKKDWLRKMGFASSEAARIRGVTLKQSKNLMKKGRFRHVDHRRQSALGSPEVENYKAKRLDTP